MCGWGVGVVWSGDVRVVHCAVTGGGAGYVRMPRAFLRASVLVKDVG